MPLTMEQIVEETRGWPAEKVGELVGLLTEDLHSMHPAIEKEWKAEIDRRFEELQSGAVRAIPGAEVSARIRKILGR